ncbi:MAG: peptidoglycan recognition family protein, partial [Candidatus Cloacimonadaceae bacterium]
DHNGMLEYPLEIKNAAKDKDIKKLTSHYIVQHASEWGDTLQAFWNQMQTHLDTKVQQAQTEEAKEQHQTNAEHMRNQRARAQKLKFFSECSSIENFPSSDIVYFLHPIRVVGEMGSGCDVAITQELLTPNEYSRPETKLQTIKAIVLHWVANPNSTAKNNRNFFENRKNGRTGYGSAHYIIGLEGEIIQCIPDDEMAYHVGAKQYTNYAKTHLGTMPNNCTIGIELTHIDWEGTFQETTLNSAICLCRKLLFAYGLNKENIIRHYDVTGKDCPKYFVDNDDEFEKFKNCI